MFGRGPYRSSTSSHPFKEITNGKLGGERMIGPRSPTDLTGDLNPALLGSSPNL